MNGFLIFVFSLVSDSMCLSEKGATIKANRVHVKLGNVHNILRMVVRN